jgi:hypothetical protein
MKNNFFVAGFVFLFLFIFFVFESSAQIEINPSLTIEEEYTDNLFLLQDNEVDDWITTIEPEIKLTYSGRSIDVLIDYSLRFLFYSKNDNQSITDFEDVQRADAKANFFAGRPFSVSISETITRETLDERITNSDFNELVNKATVYNLQVVPQYSLELSPTLSLILSYTYGRVDYSESAGNSYQEHTGGLSIIKELSSNTSVSANYSYKIHEVDTDDDFDQQDYSLGVEQQIGPRLSVGAEFGMSLLEYDTNRETEFNNWKLDANYKITESLSMSADYIQSFESSATQGVRKSSTSVLKLGYQKNDLFASAEFYWDQFDYNDIIREDELYGSRLFLDFPWTAAYSSIFEIEYQHSTFDDSITVEEVDTYTLGTKLNFEYRRFFLSLGYRYRLNDSDISANTNDYTNNTFTLSASMRF